MLVAQAYGVAVSADSLAATDSSESRGMSSEHFQDEQEDTDAIELARSSRASVEAMVDQGFACDHMRLILTLKVD